MSACGNEIDYGPGVDTFLDFYEKYNNVAAALCTLKLLVDTMQNNAVAADRVVSGLTITITGAGPYAGNVAPGTWQIGGTIYSLAAPYIESIQAADPLLDRIDLVVVRGSNNNVDILVGVPAETPAAPTPAPNELAVGIISIPANSPPIVIPPFSLPAGTAFAQTLRWDTTPPRWVINNMLKSYIDVLNPASAGTVIQSPLVGSSLVGANFFGGAAPYINMFSQVQTGPTTSSQARLTLDDTRSRLSFVNDATAGHDGQRVLAETGQLLLEADQPGAKIILASEEGVEITDRGAPANTNNKLYQVAGTLYWDGDEICTAPCGGGAGYQILNTNISAAGIYNLPNPVAENERIVHSITSGLVTVNLPPFPTPNYKITIKAGPNAGTNALTVASTGLIEDSSSDVFITNDLGSLTLIFISNGAASTWIIV